MTEKMLRKEDVALLFDVTVRTLYRWMELESMPHYKIGGALRFRLSELESWAAERHRTEWVGLGDDGADT